MPETMTQRRNAADRENNVREIARETDRESGDRETGSRENVGKNRENGRDANHLNIRDLKEMNITALANVAKGLNVPGYTGMRKQELIFQILKAQTEQSG
ncbi:MAG: Rho termination factor N-terminal domain-containing protein, partial [Acidobacteriota bacterium]|nr:Rho termination factor N-terminal domain-containing protein [Acidobacteriota bacterium]